MSSFGFDHCVLSQDQLAAHQREEAQLRQRPKEERLAQATEQVEVVTNIRRALSSMAKSDLSAKVETDSDDAHVNLRRQFTSAVIENAHQTEKTMQAIETSTAESGTIDAAVAFRTNLLAL